MSQSSIGEINALEGRIVKAEDDADDMLWQQAAAVVKLLERMTQRELAAQWINARTGKPYSQAHVAYVAQVYRDKSTYQPRPRFRDAYNEITNAHKKTSEPEDHVPFHWMNAVGDLRKLIDKWPEDARALAPKVLRELADILEGSNDSRRDGNSRAGAGRRERVENRTQISI